MIGAKSDTGETERKVLAGGINSVARPEESDVPLRNRK